MASADSHKPALPVIAEGLYSYQIGGSERVGADLALEFQRRGYQVICFAFRDSQGPLRTELESAGIRCLDVNYENVRGVLRLLRYWWSFWRMLRRERISALHVHHAGALMLCGVPARAAGIRNIVMTEHALGALKEFWRYRMATRYYWRYASQITVVEPAQAEFFHDVIGVPRQRLHYLANGVRILIGRRTAEHVRSVRESLSLPEGNFAFFYVGRLHPVKDLGTLLEAFARLPPELSGRCSLHLVGDGSERATLEAQRNALGMTARVSFLGARGDVARLLMAADAFVMSSKSEGLPLVLLEAMGAGVPCVATAVGGIPKLFGGDRGLLVPPGDPLKLSAAMALLAGSPELRERIVASALQNLRGHYEFDPIVDRYLELLRLTPEGPRPATLTPGA
jgi:L-malate glycosyltransferase